jgi:hypothetical protein
MTSRRCWRWLGASQKQTHSRTLNQPCITAIASALEALPPDTPRIVVATGRLVGEGFDHPPLDTLLLAMPVSWRAGPPKSVSTTFWSG